MPETSAFLGYWGKGWGISMSLWPSNPDKMTNLRFSETQSTNKVNRNNRRRSSAHSSTHGCICTHTHTLYTHIHHRHMISFIRNPSPKSYLWLNENKAEHISETS